MCNAITPGDTCNNKCTITRSCLDDTYNNAGSYKGLFKETVTYQFSSALTGGSYPTYDEFDGNATMPASCTYGGSSSATTPYVCVNMSAGKVSQFIASGKFLNWLTASKFDIQKQILTGGKYEISTHDLLGESRGCAGRKFIKTVPGLTGITFAIRGGSTSGIGAITNPATEYGNTYIEIYQGTYNTAACTAAMSDWKTVTTTNQGTLQGDTKCCLAGGTSTGGCSPSSTALVAANQAIHDCFWYFNGHGLSNLQPLKNACIDVWGLENPSSITDSSVGEAVCSSVLTHADSLVWPSGSTNTSNSRDADNYGYLGLCYNFTTGLWDAAGGFDSDCSLKENKDFCAALGGGVAVTDPPSNTDITGALRGVPGFVMESGLGSLTLINEYTSSGGRGSLKGFRVAVYDTWNETPWPPTGLVQHFKDLIRFGVMTFQNDGSKSECNQNGQCQITSSTTCLADNQCPSGEKCVFPIPCKKVCSSVPTRQCYSHTDCPSADCNPITATDGGELLAAVGTTIGNHTTGLIKDIDDIEASSWTPLAESYYNAMGYLARANDYPVWPATATPTSRDFNFSSLPASYVTDTNPSQSKCQKNAILLISDGMSTADRHSDSEDLASAYKSLIPSPFTGQSGTCPQLEGSKSLNVLSWVAKNRNIKTFSLTDPTEKRCSNNLFGATCTLNSECGTNDVCTNEPKRLSEYITTHVVYTGPTVVDLANLCDPYTLMLNTASNGGTTLKMASNPAQLRTELENALWEIAAGAVSGTAASVLASGEGSGANLVQAVFYPSKKFLDSATGNYDEITWTGRLTNLWYFVDPFFNLSSIREDDGVLVDGAKVLDLKTTASRKDYITSMYYDSATETAKAHRWTDPNGDGSAADGSALSDVAIENISSLWEAGTLLWQRDPATRTIYTSVTGTVRTAFHVDNVETLASYLTGTTDTTEATKVINWVRGTDVAGYRERAVKVDLNGDGDTLDTGETTKRVWKLGDILNSTPKISSWMPLNTYNKTYGDATYGVPFQDSALGNAVDNNRFTTKQAYKDRGMVYVGGNDGMLHAFKLGKLELKWGGQQTTEVAKLSGADLGKEEWAFIPKNSLPYLKYMTETGYCHIYSIDLTPYIFDASIGGDPEVPRTAGHWKTILIGGMRYGGACKPVDANCSTNTPNGVCAPAEVSGASIGYSSYFALDVTDQNNPLVLWQFSNAELGFATAGPVVLRMNPRDAGGNELANGKNLNGKWFVVLASGPTGPIGTDHQFLGRSDQNMQLFVLDLRNGALLRTIDSTIPLSFAGNMLGTALDTNFDYQDDVVYIPYTKKSSTGSEWIDGGVGRLVVKGNADYDTWSFSQVTATDLGPVTATVSKLLDTNTNSLWLFFGTGRYFYEQSGGADDGGSQRHIFGIKDPCYSASGFNATCLTNHVSTALDLGDLVSVTTTTLSTAPADGWYILLDDDGSYTHAPDVSRPYNAERNVTDPSAGGRGLVFFTTYKPYNDDCALTGRTFIWAVKYDTGGPATDLLTGTIVIQLSTGQITQVNVSTAFTEKLGRRASIGIGAPPGPGGGVISPRSAVKKVVHIKER